MRILVTNDDGIDSPGLRLLIQSIQRFDHELEVIAPDRDFSGCGTGASRPDTSSPAVLAPTTVGDVDGTKVCAPPGWIVRWKCRGEIGPAPDLVLCGVNCGRNTGVGIFGSGTFGAAFLATVAHGVPAAAISAAEINGQSADCVAEIIRTYVLERIPTKERLLTNINFPSNPALDKHCFAYLGEDFARLQLETIGQETRVRADPDRRSEIAEGSDIHLLSQGWITVTDVEVPVGLDRPIT